MYKPTRHSYEKRMKNQRRSRTSVSNNLNSRDGSKSMSGSYRISVLFDRNRKCIRGTGGRDTQHQQRECDED